jgi:arylsulfatase
VHESVAPPIKNKSHEFIAEVDLPANGGDGMLVTAGGRTAGYGLFIKNRRLTYVYNYLGIERTMLTSAVEVPAGKSELSMKFTKTGNFEGDVELFINGNSVGKRVGRHPELIELGARPDPRSLQRLEPDGLYTIAGCSGPQSFDS